MSPLKAQARLARLGADGEPFEISPWMRNVFVTGLQRRLSFWQEFRRSVAGQSTRVDMEDGRIVETGIHASLIAHGGVYANLAALQFHHVQVVH